MLVEKKREQIGRLVLNDATRLNNELRAAHSTRRLDAEDEMIFALRQFDRLAKIVVAQNVAAAHIGARVCNTRYTSVYNKNDAKSAYE